VPSSPKRELGVKSFRGGSSYHFSEIFECFQVKEGPCTEEDMSSLKGLRLKEGTAHLGITIICLKGGRGGASDEGRGAPLSLVKAKRP